MIKDYDPSIPEISIDIYLLEQSFLNLINNAKESLVDGEVLSPEIRIITRVLHRELLGEIQYKTVCKISVIDNGPGIPKNLKDSIFFPMILYTSIEVNPYSGMEYDIVALGVNGLG